MYKEPSYPHDLSYQVVDLLKLLLRKDPSKRPSASTLLDHPWFKKHGLPTQGQDRASSGARSRLSSKETSFGVPSLAGSRKKSAELELAHKSGKYNKLK